jgi:hypothetical protein
LAQEVVNAWGVNAQAGNSALLTGQFKADSRAFMAESKLIQHAASLLEDVAL